MKRAVGIEKLLLMALLACQTVQATPQTVKVPAQSKAPAALTGVVIGPDDKPVPHAVITYQSAGGNAPHVVHADAKGRFAIAKLRSDAYEVRAAGKGVFSEWEKNVLVRPGQTKSLTLRLIYAKEIPKEYTATKTYH